MNYYLCNEKNVSLKLVQIQDLLRCQYTPKESKRKANFLISSTERKKNFKKND